MWEGVLGVRGEGLVVLLREGGRTCMGDLEGIEAD